MATNVKVGIDEFQEVDMSSGSRLYADDLEGCTVAAALWPANNEGKIPAFFAHFGATTIMDENQGQALVNKVSEGLVIATSMGEVAPEKAWLAIAINSDGSEKYQAGNNLVREMMRAAGITTIDERQYRVPQYGPQTVELRPGTNDPFIMP